MIVRHYSVSSAEVSLKSIELMFKLGHHKFIFSNPRTSTRNFRRVGVMAGDLNERGPGRKACWTLNIYSCSA